MSKWFEVVLYAGENEVYRDIVKSKESRTAISNVLVNKYKGEVTKVEATVVLATVKIEKVSVGGDEE